MHQTVLTAGAWIAGAACGVLSSARRAQEASERRRMRAFERYAAAGRYIGMPDFDERAGSALRIGQAAA